jgi:AcrR family transcriptional regulator
VAAILETARGVMRAEGAGALTLAEVARRMGMRPPSLYEYFPSKHALYDALFRLGFELYAERLALIRAQPTPLDAVRVNLEQYLAFAQENPELYQLCFERPVPGFVPSAESLAVSQAMLAGAVAQVEGYVASGQVQPLLGLTALQTFDLINAVTHGLTALHRANEPHLPPGQGRFGSLVPAVVELFRVAGMLPG